MLGLVVFIQMEPEVAEPIIGLMTIIAGCIIWFVKKRNKRK